MTEVKKTYKPPTPRPHALGPPKKTELNSEPEGDTIMNIDKKSKKRKHS